MSQHDMNLADAAGSAFLADLNLALPALVSNNSGPTAPTTTFEYMWWPDTTTGIMKQRNGANSAWINVFDMATGLPYATGTPNASSVLRGDKSWGDVSASKYLLDRLDNTATIFTKTANATASVKAYTSVYARNALISVSATAQAVVMPSLSIGTDYAIYACDDLTFRADSSFTAPTGYTTANSRRIGGFHYSPGGHSGSPGGGNSTPQINEYSFWDLKFKPAAKDPRGMTLVAGAFWRDIYLLGVDHQTNGTSKYAVTIADGSSPPKVPALFGGNGSTTYPGLDWFAASEIMKSYGKRLMTYDELSASSYGTTEASSIGTDQLTTQWNQAYVSKWGANQVTGVMYIWSSELDRKSVV